MHFLHMLIPIRPVVPAGKFRVNVCDSQPFEVRMESSRFEAATSNRSVPQSRRKAGIRSAA